MASQFYCTGPVQIFTSATGTTAAPVYLGVSEGDVVLNFESKFSEVKADYSGEGIADMQYEGQLASAKFTLVRYNESVLSGLLAFGASFSLGNIGVYDVGNLVVTQGNSFRMLFHFPYSAQTVFSTMVSSVNFPNCILADGQDISVGTKIKKAKISIKAIPSWSISGANYSGVLWNTDTTGMPSIN